MHRYLEISPRLHAHAGKLECTYVHMGRTCIRRCIMTLQLFESRIHVCYKRAGYTCIFRGRESAGLPNSSSARAYLRSRWPRRPYTVLTKHVKSLVLTGDPSEVWSGPNIAAPGTHELARALCPAASALIVYVDYVKARISSIDERELGSSESSRIDCTYIR